MVPVWGRYGLQIAGKSCFMREAMISRGWALAFLPGFMDRTAVKEPAQRGTAETESDSF